MSMLPDFSPFLTRCNSQTSLDSILSDRNQTQIPLSKKGHLFDQALEPANRREQEGVGLGDP